MTRPTSKILSAAEAKAVDLDAKIAAQTKVWEKAKKLADAEETKLGTLVARKMKAEAKKKPASVDVVSLENC